MAPEGRDLEFALMRLAWRADAIDRWREQVEKHLTILDDRVGNLTKSDEIAQAVAEKMRSERHLQLTVVQKCAAFAVGAVTVADLMKGLVS